MHKQKNFETLYFLFLVTLNDISTSTEWIFNLHDLALNYNEKDLDPNNKMIY